MAFYNTIISFDVYQVFKKEPGHFPFFFKCVMEAVLAGDEAGLTLKEQTVLLVFLDHCFNSLVRTTTLISICHFENAMSLMLLYVGSVTMLVLISYILITIFTRFKLR